MEVREADVAEIDALAKIWYDGWQDAHAHLVPAELARHRTLESFRERLAGLLPDTRVVGAENDPLGFCIVKHDELYQLYVAENSRGKGAAAALMADAEARLAERGVRTAWLACAIGNERAARFYEKSGWRRARNFVSDLPTAEGIFRLEVWRYERELPAVPEVLFQRADLPQLKELLKVFADAFEEPETYLGAVPSDDYLTSLLNGGMLVPVVAITDGRVIGGLAAYILHKFEQERSEIYIYDLAVDAAYRRRHVAKGLIHHLREIAREIGAYVIYVQADHGDDPAIKLYESLGTREDVLHFDIEP